MPLVIKESLQDHIPITVKSILAKMSDDEQAMFQSEFERKKKSTSVMVILAIFFPIQLFLLREIVLGILFLFTCGGLGIWWIIEIFITPRRVRNYNKDIATEIITELRILRE
jgi:TM2 domain.